jgi:predicted AAA+ superfamily ATPase
MQNYLERRQEKYIKKALARSPVVAILGPRQCGKSTLAKQYLKKTNSVYLDLQNRVDRNMLTEPELFLDQHRKELVCLDEIQLMPDFFSVLRSEVDADRRPGRFLILGSASRDLIRQSSESLAGRIAYVPLSPFLLDETDSTTSWQQLWTRGGFPDSLLAVDEEMSLAWREDFIQTFLERDIPQLGFNIPAPIMGRLWRLLAHYHGQTINYSKLAGAMDLSVPTLKKYLLLLEQTFMLHLLPPAEVNIKKRLSRAPKVYLSDSGILHALLDINDFDHLLAHPSMGASWEGFCIKHVLEKLPKWSPSFLRTSNGAEVDLLMTKGSRTLFFEFKSSKAPKLQRGFTELMNDIKPHSCFVLAPVDRPYSLKSNITVIHPSDFMQLEADLFER